MIEKTRKDHRQIIIGDKEFHDLVEVRVISREQADKEWEELLRKKREASK